MLMIELISVTKQYAAVTALHDINLYIPARQIIGILGKSGAGKSSLLRTMNLLEKPTQGEVWFNGQELTQLSATQLRKTRQQMGMIFQHFNLLHQKTAFDNIALPLRLLKVSESAIAKRVTELLAITQMTEKRDAYPLQLSGGQRQRIAIARALATHPKILLCDEATSALDPATTQTILKLLQDINQQFGITIILITHEISVVKSICDRVVKLDRGKIICDQPILDFFIKPSGNSNQFNMDLPYRIPEPIQAQLISEPQANTLPLWHIMFYGEAAKQPIIADLIKRYQVDISILEGNIEYIQHQPLGHLLITLAKDGLALPEEIEHQVKQRLRDYGLYIEELGYVS